MTSGRRWGEIALSPRANKDGLLVGTVVAACVDGDGGGRVRAADVVAVQTETSSENRR